MGKLLFDVNPLVIDPIIATKIGLNESIIIQQIHYWVNQNQKDNRNFFDGYYWTYNSYTEWQKQFPFFSYDTIKRTIKRLETSKIIISGNYNKMSIDRTKWYRIDYDVLESLVNSPLGQNAPMVRAKCTDQKGSMHSPIPETTTEITSDIHHHEEGEITHARGDDLYTGKKDFFTSINELIRNYVASDKLIRKDFDYCQAFTCFIERYKQHTGMFHPKIEPDTIMTFVLQISFLEHPESIYDMIDWFFANPKYEYKRLCWFMGGYNEVWRAIREREKKSG